MRTHFKFWPKTLPHDLAVPATSLWHNLRVSAERYPDKVAIVFLGRETTYRELAAQVDALAGTLHAMGVQRGDRVILDMQNSAQLVVAHFAILRANAVVVPVNPMNRAEEIKHYISDSDAKVAITTGDLAAEIAAASDALPPEERLAHLIVTQFSDAFDANAAGPEAPVEAWRDWLATRHPLPALAGGQVTAWTDALSAGHPAPEHTVGAGDMALLPYTSGTTGLPKGCIHLHSSLMHNAVAGMYWGQATSEVVGLVVVPLFHITGIVSVLHCTVAASGTMVIMPRWDREMAGRLISGRKVTSWTNIPTMVVDLLASPNFASFDMSSLSYIGGGGAAMPQAVAQRLLEQYGLRYIEGYGMTETSAPSHSNPMDHPKQQCLGIPFISTDARVVDPDTLKEQPVGEAGEIIVHGPQVMQGYWNDPKPREFITRDGWLLTGDVARMDVDGYCEVVARKREMILAGDYQVFPRDVEEVLYEHPKVREVAVVGVQPARWPFQRVKAYVVLRAGQDASEDELIALCKRRLEEYAVPWQIEFRKELPKNFVGKVVRRLLVE